MTTPNFNDFKNQPFDFQNNQFNLTQEEITKLHKTYVDKVMYYREIKKKQFADAQDKHAWAFSAVVNAIVNLWTVGADYIDPEANKYERPDVSILAWVLLSNSTNMLLNFAIDASIFGLFAKKEIEKQKEVEELNKMVQE
jgi:hypothetical protein